MYLRKKGKRWYYTIYITEADGTKKPHERVGGNTKRDAERAFLRENRRQDRFGRIQWLKEVTVEQYYEEWLVNYVEVNLRPATIDMYKSILTHHIYPAVGQRKLYTISTIDLQRILNEMKASYKRSTVRLVLTVLKKGFKDATLVYDYLDKNPAEGLFVPKYNEEREKDEVLPFSPAQLKILFERFPVGHQFYIPMMLSYYTGMRIGECLALKWSDIDLAARQIYVHATQYDRNGYIEILHGTKTHQTRYVAISSALLQILIEHREKQLSLKKELKADYQDTGFVCVFDNGQQMTQGNLRFFNLFCRKEFGPGFCIHSLRHTHVVKLIEGGVEMDYISKRVGHSDIRTTSRWYSHITEKRDQIALEIIDRAL